MGMSRWGLLMRYSALSCASMLPPFDFDPRVLGCRLVKQYPSFDFSYYVFP